MSGNTKPDWRGGFRARVAYALQALNSVNTQGNMAGREFDSCFENYDGEAVVAALILGGHESPVWRLSLGDACLEQWRATAEAHRGADLDALSRRLIAESKAAWEKTFAEMRARQSEPVTLADGPADQALIPGVAPVPLSARQLAAEQARREQRRGAAPLPSGGLWDETAIKQQELF